MPESKRLLGIVPNHRTFSSLKARELRTAGEKFKVASEDALDRGTLALAAAHKALNRSMRAGSWPKSYSIGDRSWSELLRHKRPSFVVELRQTDEML